MKTLMISLVLLVTTQQLLGQRWTSRKAYNSISVGVGMFQELENAGSGNPTGYALHTSFDRRIGPRIEIGVALAHQRIPYKSSFLTNKNSYSFSGNVTSRFYLFENRSLFYKREEFNPYLRLGVGYLRTITNLLGQESIVKRNLAYDLGIGIKFKISNRVDLLTEYLQLRSLSKKAELIQPIFQNSSYLRRWQNWEFRVGVRYFLAKAGIRHIKLK